jgi:AcrR family transcriptional regulator
MKRPKSSAAPPPQRLIDAAIQEIERHGLAHLTVRAVAAAAGMNVAAVNYYFRSKEALVAAALEGTIRHMVQDTEELIARMPEDPVRVLAELLGYYLEGGLRFRQIGKAHLHDAFVADDYSGSFPRLFSPAMQSLRDAIRDAVPGLDEAEAARRVVAALSAVYFPAFFAGLYRPLAALETAEDRAIYVNELARQTLAKSAPAASRR